MLVEIKSLINNLFSKWFKRGGTSEVGGSTSVIQNHSGPGDNVAGNKIVYTSEKAKISDVLTYSWFDAHLTNSVDNLGNRYTPKLNVELEISKTFDAISRNDSFRQFTRVKFNDFLVTINKSSGRMQGLSSIEDLSAAVGNVESVHAAIQGSDLENIDIEGLDKAIKVINDVLIQYEKQVDESKAESSDYKSHEINNVRHAIYEFSDFIKSPILNLANNPVVLISGDAGIGKSHLLADIATTRAKNEKPCILLLGQHFTSDESPWTQILDNLLRVDCNEEEFLSALNAKAEMQGERILLIIDAINEGRGRFFWPDYINGFINEFLKYPWIGLVLSVRTSYESVLISKKLIDDRSLIKINHYGFDSVEFKALSLFFSQYGIEQPSIPLLNPEFSNPLFLKLFCEGLKRSGLTTIPKGYGGISQIINTFINSIEEKLSKPTFFDYPPGRHLIRRIIDEFIAYKLENELSFIPYEIAIDIANNTLSKFSHKRGFLEALISEGILSQNLFWDKDGEYEDGVYLAYERFEDHLATSYLLDKYLDENNIETLFRAGGKLSRYIDKSHLNQGVLESLSIQVPERTGKELYDLIENNKKKYSSVIEAFINSLVWRKPGIIKDDTKKYINKYILPFEHSSDLFFQMVYSVASDPDHFYNADRLHHYLMQFTLADRDAVWTVYLHNQDYEETAMHRLIVWAKSNENKSYLSDSARLLAAKALAWLLTSTNIIFRDSATTALVMLLENKISTILDLLKEFSSINDPYVYERVFAAAYGAVLRSDDLDSLGNLSQYLYEEFFDQDEVYENVLVRDYARNIVEYAVYKEVSYLADISIIRPPYKSTFPSSFPTNDEIDAYKYDYNSKDFKDYFWGQNSILSSMTTEYGRGVCRYGDFGRYTFQSKFSNWEDFDPNDLSNFACKLIFEEYGYDVEKHGRFDRSASSGNRSANKKERIGKKYQWIALYEVLARLSDNHKMVDSSTRWSDDKEHVWFQGPWSPFVRNIDPTVVSQKSPEILDNILLGNAIDYAEWDEEPENWLVNDRGLPNFEHLISFTDLDNEEWLVLDSHHSWEEPVPLGQDKYNYPRKHLWYQVKSYLIKENESEILSSRLKGQSFMGPWLPQGTDRYQVFSREYYWSPAYHFLNNPYYGGDDWEEVYDKKDRSKLIGHVISTSEGHRWESGADYDDKPTYLAPCEVLFSGMNLQYSKNAGEWLDQNEKVVCYDPSVNHDASSALIVKKEHFLSFLKENNLKVIWACLGEKNIYGTLSGNEHYTKWLELSGIYTLNGGNIEGETIPIIK